VSNEAPRSRTEVPAVRYLLPIASASTRRCPPTLQTTRKRRAVAKPTRARVRPTHQPEDRGALRPVLTERLLRVASHITLTVVAAVAWSLVQLT
jgi:hypothetical protein